MDAPAKIAAARRPSWRDVTRRLETRLLATWGAIACALAGFAALAAEAKEGDIGAVDRVILLMFRHHGALGTPIGPRWLQESARDITALGGFTVLTLVIVLAALLLVMNHRGRHAAVLVGAVVVSQVVSEIIKHVIDRPRPALVPHLDMVYSSSFPSGHAMMSPVVYLTLAAVVSTGLEPAGVRGARMTAAALLVVLIGVSRVYLGVHWPTDVLGGWILGSAIAAGASSIVWLNAPRAAAPRPA